MLSDLQSKLNELKTELREDEEYWRKEQARLQAEIVEVEKLIQADIDGVDTDRLLRGKAVVRCSGYPYRTQSWYNTPGQPKACDVETREKALRDAIERIPDDYLDRTNVIVKLYDRFDEQREDSWRGPYHGTVVFIIHRVKRDYDKPLSAQEKSDAMYYLSQILSGKVTWDAMR